MACRTGDRRSSENSADKSATPLLRLHGLKPTLTNNDAFLFDLHSTIQSHLISNGSMPVLKRQTRQDFEVCISDDCSTDGRAGELQQLLRQLQIAFVYRRQPKNSRYGANLRGAIALASGEYCLLMGNDNCLAEETTLESLRTSLRNHPKTGVAITTNYAVLPTFRGSEALALHTLLDTSMFRCLIALLCRRAAFNRALRLGGSAFGDLQHHLFCFFCFYFPVAEPLFEGRCLWAVGCTWASSATYSLCP